MTPLLDRLPSERAGYAAEGDVAELRLRIADGITAGVWASDPKPSDITANGISALRFDPLGTPVATVVHFHGGGYRIGCPDYVAPFAAALALRCGVTVMCPRYRLAPEHPFPAALNDGLAFLRGITGANDRLIICGDSAGGGLAASLTALRVADGVPPSGLILLSAWLDLRITSNCYFQNSATDSLFSREAASAAADAYLQGASAEHPSASPLLASVSGFPPTFINYGSGEVLADDSRIFAILLAQQGTAVQCDGITGMDHVAVTRSLELPGAAETFEAMAAFIDGLTGRTNNGLAR